jgi:hypothetical protein
VKLEIDTNELSPRIIVGIYALLAEHFNDLYSSLPVPHAFHGVGQIELGPHDMVWVKLN